jgi:RNA polymerase sigma factor (sigma-70 family)
MDDKRGRFEALVLPHLDAAYRFARWLGGSAGDADDVVQEAFLRAWRSFDTLRGEDGKAWLLAIVRNCHATALQQRQRRASEPLPEEHDAAWQSVAVAPAFDPESATAAEGERRILERLMGALPAEQREVLTLRELEDMSYREIATLTQAPIGTVMSRLARARTALREQWLKQEERGVPRAVR